MFYGHLADGVWGWFRIIDEALEWLEWRTFEVLRTIEVAVFE